MPTKLGVVAGCSMTRPCECGLAVRPWRLFGFRLEPVDGAPCFSTGSLTLGGCGLPSTERLADCFRAGNGKIQGERFTSLLHHVDVALLEQAYKWLKQD